MIYENPKVISIKCGGDVVISSLSDEPKPLKYVLIRHLNFSGHNSIVAFGNDKKALNDIILHLSSRAHSFHQTYFICDNFTSSYSKDVALLNICKNVANCLEIVDINFNRGHLAKARNIFKLKIPLFLYDAGIIFSNYETKK